VAGYSEGGFCAANMALHYPHRYGFAGVLSGYFEPLDNQPAGSRVPVSPFGGDDWLREQNTPFDELLNLPATTVVPRFWLGAGGADGQDVANAERFLQELRPRQPGAPLTVNPGTGHTMTTWRAQVPSMLSWMTPRLAHAAGQAAVWPAKTATVADRRRVAG
jgi:enterochelin esterase-like enzyme